MTLAELPAALGRFRTGFRADTPSITPNKDGLPGITQADKIVGALLTYGLIFCVVGMVVSAIAIAIGNHSQRPELAGRGKTGVISSASAAILIGSATALVGFFAGITLTTG